LTLKPDLNVNLMMNPQYLEVIGFHIAMMIYQPEEQNEKQEKEKQEKGEMFDLN
jgi:hypothetical protein